MTLLSDRTTETVNTHVSLVGSALTLILRNSKAVISDSLPINEPNFAAQCSLALLVHDVIGDNLDVQLEQALGQQVEDKPQHEGIDEEVDMYENESTNESGYAKSTHDNVCHIIGEVLVEH